VRTSDAELPASTIAYDAARPTPFANDEVLLPLAGAVPGQFTYSVGGCGSATYNFTGVPITNFAPPGGLLPPDGASVAVAFDTLQPTTCRYSVRSNPGYASMQPLDTGSPTATHNGIVAGLSTDPRTINQVYFQCASNPDYLLTETYRVLAPPGQAFPRIGDIWIGGYLYSSVPPIAQQTQLFLGPGMSGPEAIQLRSGNPGALIIPAVNVRDHADDGSIPETYFLRDIHGNKIADWCTNPPLYLVNVTNPAVTQFLAQLAYQQVAQPNLPFDGSLLRQLRHYHSPAIHRLLRKRRRDRFQRRWCCR
jgi:hypothetical protein